MGECPVLLKIEKLNTKSPFEFFKNRKNRKKRGFFVATPPKMQYYIKLGGKN